MNDDAGQLVFYHSPQTRSTGVRILLEELAAPHEMRVLNMQADEQREPAYLAVNPMGKVPAIVWRGALVTEQAAIYQYLADLFPAVGLAPALDDPLRGPYLRWLAFYGNCLEPAVTDRANGREPAPRRMSPYGDYDTVMQVIEAQLTPGPYLFGDRLTAADILWGVALGWLLRFKVVPETPAITAYAARIAERPAVVRVSALDAELAASHEAAARS